MKWILAFVFILPSLSHAAVSPNKLKVKCDASNMTQQSDAQVYCGKDERRVCFYPNNVCAITESDALEKNGDAKDGVQVEISNDYGQQGIHELFSIVADVACDRIGKTCPDFNACIKSKLSDASVKQIRKEMGLGATNQ